MKAKAGDRIGDKARERIRNAIGVNYPLRGVPTTVEKKNDGTRGQWVCITCGEFLQNNLDADCHLAIARHDDDRGSMNDNIYFNDTIVLVDERKKLISLSLTYEEFSDLCQFYRYGLRPSPARAANVAEKLETLMAQLRKAGVR